MWVKKLGNRLTLKNGKTHVTVLRPQLFVRSKAFGTRTNTAESQGNPVIDMKLDSGTHALAPSFWCCGGDRSESMSFVSRNLNEQ